MLSVLIPVYNYPVDCLVADLHAQCQVLPAFEIIVADDASTDIERCNYGAIEALFGVEVVRNEKNAGRAAIRNMLAERANYDTLLFLDCDAEIVSTSFVETYIRAASCADVVCGGTAYSRSIPEKKEELFRWAYGQAREQRTADERNIDEYSSFTSFNFLIKKDLFLSIKFDENITNYGHEDTLFGVVLERKSVHVLHIENPALHAGLETGEAFLAKTERGVETLCSLIADAGYRQMLVPRVTLLNAYERCERLGIGKVVAFFFAITGIFLRWAVLKTLSLALFDAYKLGYLCKCMKR